MTMRTRFFSTKYLGSWCENEAQCDSNEIKIKLMLWLAKFAFFSWLPDLPEHDFGTTLASFVQDFIGEKGKDGFNTFVGAAFGDNWLKHFKMKDGQMKRPHPSNIMQLFVPSPAFSPPSVDLNSLPRNFTKLSKLLLYQGFVKAKSKMEGMSSGSGFVEEKLNLYPYTLKENSNVRGFNSSEVLKMLQKICFAATNF